MVVCFTVGVGVAFGDFEIEVIGLITLGNLEIEVIGLTTLGNLEVEVIGGVTLGDLEIKVVGSVTLQSWSPVSEVKERRHSISYRHQLKLVQTRPESRRPEPVLRW